MLPDLERMDRGGGVLLIKHFVCRGDSARLGMDGSRAAAPPAPNNENNDNEKRGIPNNPPRQRTQGKNTPLGAPLTPTMIHVMTMIATARIVTISMRIAVLS